jgi:glyoxylase-like metal-dependent hydrolase (beta-lactamase superfamily II)
MATLTTPGATLTVETFRARDGGCLAYLLVDAASRTALAIDARTDQVDQFEAALGARGARLAYVIDTHTHADHLSGARALARRAGATALAHAASKLRWPARRVKGGERLDLGATVVAILDAPGHTPDSLAVLAGGHLFTGDALFVGGAGRTDFPGGSASDLFDTFRMFETLPDDIAVHPGHDYVGRAVSTIGEEKSQNPLLRERDRAAFVARLSTSTPPPANMASIIRANLGEANAATIAPRDLHALLGHEPAPWLLDVRTPIEFESEHIDRAALIPLDELESRLAEIPEHADVVAVCRTGVRATGAAETLGRAGRRARVLEGGMNAWRQARLPVREGRKRLPVDRQVQLIAGVMVLAGVALGLTVSPWFLAVAAFFGAGLTFAGASGTCGLALVLMKMPWNRSPAAPPAGPAAVCAAGGGPAPPTCAAPTQNR